MKPPRFDYEAPGSVDSIEAYLREHPDPRPDEVREALAGNLCRCTGYLGYTDDGTEPSQAGDVVFTPAGHWHGFNNTSSEDVLLIWGWEGAGSLEAAGYELPDDA